MAFQKPEPGQPVMVEIAGQLFQIEYRLTALRMIEQQTRMRIFTPEFVEALRGVTVLVPVLLIGINAIKTNPPNAAEWLEQNINGTADLGDVVLAVHYALFGGKQAAENPPTTEPAPAMASVN